MPKITLHIEMDSFEEARDFFSARAANAPAPSSGAPAASVVSPGPASAQTPVSTSAAAPVTPPTPATASAASPSAPATNGATDPLAGKRKETTDAMLAYVAKGEGRSAKTAKEIQTNAGVLKGIREATDAQLDTLLLAYQNS